MGQHPTGAHPAVVRPPTGEYPTQPLPPTGEYPAQRPQPTGEYLAVRQEQSQPEEPGLLSVGREIRSHAASGRDGRRARPAGGRAHRHAADTGLSVSRRTATIVRWILIPCAVLTAVLLIALWPDRPEIASTDSDASLQRAYGEVLQVTEVPCPEGRPAAGPPMPCGTAIVHVSSGPGAGQDVTVDLPQGPGAPRLSAGDGVVLSYLADPSGGPPRIGVMDQQRGSDLLVMFALCAIAVIAFGRWRGFTALVGLGVSFGFLLLFIIPAILGGQAPLPVAIVGSAAIMFAVLYLTHGFTVTTSVAVLGTLVSLVVTGLLGALFTATTSLTGFGSEEAFYVSFLNVDMRGLLLAGIIIGALGVLDDVTITQATTVAELATTATSRLALFRSAIRVGRAHVGSAVNTIVLAYAGASLPLLLLITAGGQDVGTVLTSPILAQEIVRAAVGTIGLVAAVPITTGLAALVADLRGAPDRDARRAPDPRRLADPRREPLDPRRESPDPRREAPDSRRDRPRRDPEPGPVW